MLFKFVGTLVKQWVNKNVKNRLVNWLRRPKTISHLNKKKKKINYSTYDENRET